MNEFSITYVPSSPQYLRAGDSKLWPADEMRPAKPSHPAREAILSMMKNNVGLLLKNF